MASSTSSGKFSGLVAVGLLFVLLEGVVIAYWVASGASMVTVYQVPVEVTEEDEFGDEITRTVMQDEFKFGLLPDKGPDAALPWMVLFSGISVACFVVNSRRKSSNTSS
jgi:hypothetical protein